MQELNTAMPPAAPASIDTPAFWARANAWASSTIDTAARAATLVEFIHDWFSRPAAAAPASPAAAPAQPERTRELECVIADLIAECKALRAAMPARELTDAARDVLSERQRQKDIEGWTAEFDDTYKSRELARAAACYAYPELSLRAWPWTLKWWKPTTERRNLIKSAALALAEIERLDRACPPP